MLESINKGKAKNKSPTVGKSLKEKDIDWGHVRKLWGRLYKKKRREWKLPTLKGKSKIKERERLSSHQV